MIRMSSRLSQETAEDGSFQDAACSSGSSPGSYPGGRRFKILPPQLLRLDQRISLYEGSRTRRFFISSRPAGCSSTIWLAGHRPGDRGRLLAGLGRHRHHRRLAILPEVSSDSRPWLADDTARSGGSRLLGFLDSSRRPVSGPLGVAASLPAASSIHRCLLLQLAGSTGLAVEQTRLGRRPADLERSCPDNPSLRWHCFNPDLPGKRDVDCSRFDPGDGHLLGLAGIPTGARIGLGGLACGRLDRTFPSLLPLANGRFCHLTTKRRAGVRRAQWDECAQLQMLPILIRRNIRPTFHAGGTNSGFD